MSSKSYKIEAEKQAKWSTAMLQLPLHICYQQILFGQLLLLWANGLDKILYNFFVILLRFTKLNVSLS
jgi:hypothetical protein